MSPVTVGVIKNIKNVAENKYMNIKYSPDQEAKKELKGYFEVKPGAKKARTKFGIYKIAEHICEKFHCLSLGDFKRDIFVYDDAVYKIGDKEYKNKETFLSEVEKLENVEDAPPVVIENDEATAERVQQMLPEGEVVSKVSGTKTVRRDNEFLALAQRRGQRARRRALPAWRHIQRLTAARTARWSARRIY